MMDKIDLAVAPIATTVLASRVLAEMVAFMRAHCS